MCSSGLLQKNVLGLKKGLLMLLFSVSAGLGFSQASDFVTKWDLSQAGTTGNNSISFFTTNAAGAIAYTWQELSPGSAQVEHCLELRACCMLKLKGV